MRTPLALGALLGCALAKPLVVDVDSDWHVRPFVLDVLETISAKNESSYFPLLSLYLSHQEQEGSLSSDQKVAGFLMERALESAFISPAMAKLVNAELAVQSKAAYIEAHYQQFTDTLAATFGDHLKECDNVFYYNGKASCDSSDVFALETISGGNEDEFNTPLAGMQEKVIGGVEDAPIALLYADVLSEEFPQLHANLLASALEGKVTYILRYKPSKVLAGKQHKVAGYGATVQVKRTDYLVVDDRPVKESKKGSQVSLNIDAPNKVTKEELVDLPKRAASYIFGAQDQFSALVDTVLNFPARISKFKDAEISEELLDDIKANQEAGYVNPGTNAILINGALQNSGEQRNVFDTLKGLGRELALVESLTELGLEPAQAIDVLSSAVVLGNGSDSSSTKRRYEYRSPAISWINDIEQNPQYGQWSSDYSVLLEPQNPQSPLVPLRRNMNNLVMAIDLSSGPALQMLLQVFQVLARGAPIHVGIVPLGVNDVNSAFMDAGSAGGFIGRQAFIYGLAKGLEPEEAKEQAIAQSKENPSGGNSAPRSLVYKEAKQWLKRFAVRESALLANGVFIEQSQDWLYDSMDQFLKDQEAVTEIVKAGEIEDTSDETLDILARLLKGAPKWRDELLDPLSASEVAYISTLPLYQNLYGLYASWAPSNATLDSQNLWVISDFSTEAGFDQVTEALKLAINSNVRLNIAPVVDHRKLDDENYIQLINTVLEMQVRPNVVAYKGLEALRPFLFEGGDKPSFFSEVKEIADKNTYDQVVSTALREAFGVHRIRTNNLILNGRLITLDGVVPEESLKELLEREKPRVSRIEKFLRSHEVSEKAWDAAVSILSEAWLRADTSRVSTDPWSASGSSFTIKNDQALIEVTLIVDPASEAAQELVSYAQVIKDLGIASLKVFLSPKEPDPKKEASIPNRYFKPVFASEPIYGDDGNVVQSKAQFDDLEDDVLYVVGVSEPASWVVMTKSSDHDLDNVILGAVDEPELRATYELRALLLEGFSQDVTTGQSPRGIQLRLSTKRTGYKADTMVMSNLGYYQFQAGPGLWTVTLADGPSADIFEFVEAGTRQKSYQIWITEMTGIKVPTALVRKSGQEKADVLAVAPSKSKTKTKKDQGFFGRLGSNLGLGQAEEKHADVNIFTVASGHLYERFLSIMTLSVMRHSKHTVKFWLIENFLSPSFKAFLPTLAEKYNFQYELVTYKWPAWLRAQSEKQREIWGYKILFLDTLFPQTLDKVIFVDSDQIVRTDLKELVDLDLQGAPYGYTPMGDDREETEGFRFWKQGYWKKFLEGKPYHISALYVVDLDRFREIGAGDKLRQHYQQLSADPNSLSNLDQDLPNNLQHLVPIYSLDKDWLWCETWSSDESLETAKTIDLCNNPLTKEPKLTRARRQIPEWTTYDDEVAELRRKYFSDAKPVEHLVVETDDIETNDAEPVETDEVEDHDEL